MLLTDTYDIYKMPPHISPRVLWPARQGLVARGGEGERRRGGGGERGRGGRGGMSESQG